MDFTFPWRSKTVESVNASCPVVDGNNVFISATYQTGGAMLAVQPDFTFKELWKSDDFGVHFMTPILKDGYLYGFDGRHDIKIQSWSVSKPTPARKCGARHRAGKRP